METKQTKLWDSDFGAAYTDRNTYSVESLDEVYKNQYGWTRSEMNKHFLTKDQIGTILEVGCNIGNQLRVLQSAGYSQLYGIEIQHYAVEKAKQLCQRINIIQGSAFDIPFRDSYFDLVYTSGVLIHISPEDIAKALSEIYRVSKRYIWGFEYYADTYEEKKYHNNSEAMWKTNFCELYLQRFPDLKVVQEMKFPYTQSENIDQMFLLEKTGRG